MEARLVSLLASFSVVALQWDRATGGSLLYIWDALDYWDLVDEGGPGGICMAYPNCKRALQGRC